MEEEGEIGVEDKIELIKSDENKVTIRDIVRLQTNGGRDTDMMNRAIKVKDLPDGWRNYFMEKLTKLK